MASAVFHESHASSIGGHCGVEKTHHAVITRYYWPGMEADIRKWVSVCQCVHIHCTHKPIYGGLGMQSMHCQMEALIEFKHSYDCVSPSVACA